MNNPALAGMAVRLTSRIARVPRRVWVMLGLTALLLIALAVWAAIALLSHAWNTGNALLDRGGQAAAVLMPQAQQRIDAVAPELRDQIERGRAAIGAVAPETTRRLKEVVPDMAAAPTAGTVAVLAGVVGAAVVGEDVVGEDPASVPRHPALARTGYALTDAGRDVSYAGPVAFTDVLAFYRQPLVDAGFTERVIASSASNARLEYRKGERALMLTVTAKGDAASEVRIVEN